MMSTSVSLAGQRAVVTGAASGIGRALVHELRRRGAAVTAVDRDDEGLRAVCAETGATAAALDVRDEAGLEALATALEADGAIDLIFANAGVAAIGPSAMIPMDDLRWMLDVNVLGVVGMVRRFLPAMLRRGRGRVVLTASIAGLLGAPGMSGYSATKFAVVGFAEALQVELAGTGVTATVVCPGFVRTGFHRATRYHNAGFRSFLDRAPDALGLSADEVARAAVDGALAGRSRVTLGVERAAVWLKDLSPNTYVALASRAARVLGLLGREREAGA